MATFPYYIKKPHTGGRVAMFSQATSALDVPVRELVAAWLLQYDQGATAEVELYYNEVVARDITTEPFTGPEIRAYRIARNLLEYAERGTDWDDTVTDWLDEFAELAGIETGRENLWYNWEFEGGVSGIGNDDAVLPPPLEYQNTNGTVQLDFGIGTIRHESITDDTRCSYRYQIQNPDAEALIVGNRYEVHVVGNRIGDLPEDGEEGGLRVFNFNNTTSVEHPNGNGVTILGVEADVLVEFDATQIFDVTGPDYELDIRFGQGVWSAQTDVTNILEVAIYDLGPTPPDHLLTVGNNGNEPGNIIAGYWEGQSMGGLVPNTIEGYDDSIAQFTAHDSFNVARLITTSGNQFLGVETVIATFGGETFEMEWSGSRYDLTSQLFTDTMLANDGLTIPVEFELVPALRKLLDSSGEVLTNESGTVLQHNLATEDDMLFTDFMPNYSVKLDAQFDIVEETFVDVLEFDETMIEGVYEFTISYVSSNPDTNDSLYWQITGTDPSPEFAEEAKDGTDVEPDSYTYQFDHVGGAFTATLQMRKEDGNANDVEIYAAGIYVKRVG